MRQRFLIVLSFIIIIFTLTSCEQAQPEQQLAQSVNIVLENVSDPNARTIRPEEYTSPDKYAVTLTEVAASAGGGWAEVTGSQKTNTWTVTANSNSITLANVAVGNYKVGIVGLTNAGVKVLSGSSDTVLSVTPGSVNSISINLAPIEEGEDLTGTVRIGIDWSQAKSSPRFNELIANGLTVKMKDLEGNLLGSVASSDGAANGMTLEASVPVTPSQQVYFELWSGDTLITKNLRRSVIWVSSGNISIPMDGESTIMIDENDLAYGINVSNASWKYNDESSLYVDITWDNVFFKGSCLFNKIVVYYEPVDEGASGSGSVEVTDLSGEKGTVTLTDLEPGIKYLVYTQAYHTNGLISSKDPLDGTVTTKVLVTGIEISPSSLESALEIGGKINLTATITPDNASDKSITWEYDSEAFSVDSNTSESGAMKTFTVNKAGVFTIKAKTNDELATSVNPAEIKIKVNPAAPTVEKKSDNITVSWDAVANEKATYTLYRTADSGAVQIIGTQNMFSTSFEDKNIFSGVKYSYYVVATVGADTLTSTASTEVEIPESVISITLPSAGETLDINLKSQDGILALTDENSITLSAVDSSGYPLDGYTFAWYVGLEKTPISTGSTLVLNMGDHGDYFYPGEREQKITLLLTKNGRTYSGSVTIYVLSGDVPAESIVISLPDGQATRLSTEDADGNLRKIPLTTVVTPNYTTEDLEYNISVVSGTSTDQPEDIVAVENGYIVFKGGTGDITITASTPSRTSNSIELSIYQATVESAVQIVNAISTEWVIYFKEADSKFGNDWARSEATGALEYSSNGFSFKRPYLKMEGAGTSVTEGKVNLSDQNGDYITISSNTTLEFSLYDETGWGTAGPERIKTISTNNASVNVVLPFNQGTATITYESIRVKDDSGNNTRGGYYSVDFTSDILGIDGVNLDRTGDNKINDSTEAANITKLIYG